MRRRRLRRQNAKATAYKLCSLALQYPDDELLCARSELAATARGLACGKASEHLQRFFAWWAQCSALELCQHYVECFDLHKRSSLYLSFYALGDRRDRGLALLRLKKLYRAAGLPLESSELPDYLPVMLEFAGSAPQQGELVLAEHRAAIELVRLSLAERESPYAGVFDCLGALIGGLSTTQRSKLERMVAEGPPNELVGLEPFAPPEVMPTEGRR
jgi:nitrate reductase molybdenum cofactor assembly chaperone NarJ/NarW